MRASNTRDLRQNLLLNTKGPPLKGARANTQTVQRPMCQTLPPQKHAVKMNRG